LNKKPADITYKMKKTGGISFTSTVELTHCDEQLCSQILQEYRIHNADILFREDASVDEFIDIIEGNRKYLRCLYVINKIDTVSLDEVDRLAHMNHTVVISIAIKMNMDFLLFKIWEYLQFIRIYTKPRGKRPDFTQPLIMRSSSTIEHVCHSIHREMAANFKYALVWGTSAKHQPQRVGISHFIQDHDVVQIMTK